MLNFASKMYNHVKKQENKEGLSAYGPEFFSRFEEYHPPQNKVA